MARRYSSLVWPCPAIRPRRALAHERQILPPFWRVCVQEGLLEEPGGPAQVSGVGLPQRTLEPAGATMKLKMYTTCTKVEKRQALIRAEMANGQRINTYEDIGWYISTAENL